MTDANVLNRRPILEGLCGLPESTSSDLPGRLERLYAPGAQWRGAHPLNILTGAVEIGHVAWGPLLHAFPDLERRDLIFVGGHFEGRYYVAAMGHFCGTFRHDWLTIPATGRPATVRYGEVHEVRDGRIVQSNCLWDLLDLMRQAGVWPLAPSLGTEGLWLGPRGGDGIRLEVEDTGAGAENLAQTLAMHGTLFAYEDREGRGREGLLAMPQKDYWHPKMMWYGPAGIGTARGLGGFVDLHQMPFRVAFPRPRTEAEAGAVAAERTRMGGGHYIRIGDGAMSVTGGWPSRVDLHAGPGFMGLPATGRTVGMRVMDFYRHDDGLIRENWVPIDIIDLMMQLGVDLFGRMRSLYRAGG